MKLAVLALATGLSAVVAHALLHSGPAPARVAAQRAESVRRDGLARLALREIGRRAIDVRPGRFLIGADGASRTVFFFEPRRATVFRVAADTGRTLEMTLEDAPEYSPDSASLGEGALVNERGDSLISASWRSGGRRISAGVFVFSKDGRYLRTIRLNPAVELRRIARGPDGSFYALGADPASRPERRLLIHRYNAAGNRLTAFSECAPAAAQTELQHGLLWVGNGLVHHVQTAARRLRVFEPGGRMLRQSVIEQPAGAPGSIQAVAPAAGGGYLVEWAEAGTSVVQRYLTLHNEIGSLIAVPTPVPERSALIFADSARICYYLRYTPAGSQEIVRLIPAW